MHPTLWALATAGITAVRLAGQSATAYTGRVEVQIDGVWGSVCSSGFDGNAATTTCKSLGFASGARAYSTQPYNPFDRCICDPDLPECDSQEYDDSDYHWDYPWDYPYGPGNGSIHIHQTQCKGVEHSLNDCTIQRTGTCQHASDVGVVCSE